MPDPVFTLMIEPVKACNLTCRYCYSDNSWKRSMTLDTLCLALDRVRTFLMEAGFRELHILWHGGEPLLAGLDFYKRSQGILFSTFQDLPFRQFIQTNGLLLSREFCLFFRDSRFELGISLDGPREIHDPLRIGKNGSPTWAKVMKKIHLMEDLHLDFGISMTVTTQTLGREKNVYEFFTSLGHPLGINPLIPSRTNENPHLIPAPGEYGRFLCRLFDLWTATETGRIPVSPLDMFLGSLSKGTVSDCRHGTSCIGNHLGIRPNGEAVLCSPFDDLILGNILGQTVSQMYESAACTAILHRDQTIPECVLCENREICHGGCPHLAAAHRGSIKGRDPFCPDYKMIFTHIRNALVSLENGISTHD